MTAALPARAYINRIACAVPAHEVHAAFVAASAARLPDPADRKLYERMTRRSGIARRHSVLELEGAFADGLYRHKGFAATEARMALYKRHAPPLAQQALDRLLAGEDRRRITHLIVTSCTGFYAPGLDLDIIAHYGLSSTVERTQVGFMGCNAAFNALKLARHIVLSDGTARVLIVNLELCTLHLQDSDRVDRLLSYTIFADGCAASLVSAEPSGLELCRFHSTVIPDSAPLITWHIGDNGFDMVLSGKVAERLAATLPAQLPAILDNLGMSAIGLWAIHPGGRSILDAVEKACNLPGDALAVSRGVLERFGNMSSATIMFVLRDMLEQDSGGLGCAMGFGPGITAETMLFRKAAA